MSLVRLRPEAPRCRSSGAVCGRSSSGRARPCQGRGSEFEPRRPLQKRRDTRMCVSSFLERHFCCAKVIACGRMIEREWGNPQRFPPHTPPSLRWAGVQTTEPVDNHKKKHHPSGWCFLFGMSRAGLDSLPRPARSASNQEVRQGSCEWRQPFVGCREAGSSLVARSKKITTHLGGDFFACSSALTVVSAGSQPLPRPAVRTLPRNRLASSAAGGASALSSPERAS